MVATRFTLLALAASTALEAVAQPHFYGKRQHDMFHRRRDYVTTTVTTYVYASQATALPDAGVVNVNLPSDGENQSADGRKSSADNNYEGGEDQTGNGDESNAGNQGGEETPEKQPTEEKPSGGNSTPSTGGGGIPKTVVVSPYDDASQCRTQEDINRMCAAVKNQLGAGGVRIYGTDCDQVSKVLKAAKANGLKVMLGIYDISDNGKIDTALKTIRTQTGDMWDSVMAVSVGNEEMNKAFLEGRDVKAAAENSNNARKRVREALSDLYQGPVISSEVFSQIYNNPDVGCQEDSPFIAANCHPFFAGIPSSEAGRYMKTEIANIQKACPGKQVVITETGWPHSGNKNNNANPTKGDQKTAVAGICNALGDKNVVLLSAFDEKWKENNGATHGAETAYGLIA